MFHQGDLKSGIGLALQTSKAVVCFLTDETEQSDIWEKEWLTQEKVSTILTAKAVLLRLLVGSSEAQFLGAFAPVNTAPRLIVINGGKLVELLTEDLTKEPFTIRLLACLGGNEATEQPTSSETTTASSTNVTASQPSPPTPSPPTPNPPAAITNAETSNPPTSRNNNSITREPSPPRVSSHTESRSWAETQRQRNLDARRERDRILALIEADKKDRKKGKERAQVQQSNTENPSISTQSSKSKSHNSLGSANIQIRLPSGHSIRRTFSSSATPSSDLRPWIDEELAAEDLGGTAYRLKHIRGPPEPAREIAAGEENQSLAENGLVPSANLVIIPIEGAVNAYSGVGSAAGGLVWGALSVPGRVVGTVAGAVGSVLNGFIGGGRVEEESAKDESEEAKRKQGSKGSSTARVRTMAEMRAERDGERTQLYNGNQLNFQSENHDSDDEHQE